MPGLPHLIGAVLVATSLSGCALLDLLLGQPPVIDPEWTFPVPSAEATFTSGSATIELANETILLDQLASGGAMMDELGIGATWTNDDGWYLTYYGFPDMGFLPGSGYLSIDRIVETDHWVIADPSRCVTTTDRADATGVAGTAVCRGLQWSSFFTSIGGMRLPEPIPGAEAFDADVTFEAR